MRASQWSRGLADDAPAPRTATGRRLTLRATVQAIGALDVRATRVICTPCATDSTAQSTKQRLVGRKRQGFSHWFGTEAVMDAREFFQKVVVPRYTKFVRRRRSRPLPLRSANPQRKSLIVPAMQPASIAQCTASSRLRTPLLLRSAPASDGKPR